MADRTYIRIVLEVEDDPLVPHGESLREWEDALFLGGISIHVQSVNRITDPSGADRAAENVTNNRLLLEQSLPKLVKFRCAVCGATFRMLEDFDYHRTDASHWYIPGESR